MDTKLKKSDLLYITSFWISVVSLLAATAGFITAYETFDHFMRWCYSHNIRVYDFWSILFPSEYNMIFPAGAAAELRLAFIISLAAAIGASIICIASFIEALRKVGSKDEQGIVVLRKTDKFPGELQILLIITAFSLGGMGYGLLMRESIYKHIHTIYGIQGHYVMGIPVSVGIAAAIASGIIAAGIGLWQMMSIARKLKAKEFCNYTIIGRLVIRPVAKIYRGSSLMHKIMLICIIACILSATIVLAPVILVILIVFLPKYIHKYESVKEGINHAASGDFGYQIEVTGNSELDHLAARVNLISEASAAIVERELKNQKLKTDLISNVSHDLKTPLTSMVTYIDLLKTEGLDSENAPQYLEILEQKTKRLDQLTKDLFDAAKASSGAMPIEPATVDLNSLVNQALGEMNEKIEKSGLEFIFTGSGEKHYTKADGRQMWRVVDNLIGNTLKYALPGSRVYIDVKPCNFVPEAGNETVEGVVLEIKNISGQRLNIEPEVLMERFTRGDESRTTDGSGLGLAISKDLMKLMGGRFEIIIDGDLFKVRAFLKSAEAPVSEESEMPSECD